jgi:hypothetical protein
MTFAAAVAAHLSEGATMPSAITAEQTPLSFCFLGGIILLFAALWSGWMDSLALVGYRHDHCSKPGFGGCFRGPCSFYALAQLSLGI